MGAWIEILILTAMKNLIFTSLLSWERGLKYKSRFVLTSQHIVAPLVGAWIEMVALMAVSAVKFVAPLVGAWIEIYRRNRRSNFISVAPLVGAWIEIFDLK